MHTSTNEPDTRRSLFAIGAWLLSQAGFVWGGVFRHMRDTSHGSSGSKRNVLILAGQLSTWGKPTFMILAARSNFVNEHTPSL
jgi:hypothetical protein